MNRIVLAGRLARDPELRACNSGTEVCNFTVAVDRRVKKDQEKQADFIDCTAWGKTGVFVNQYFRKGDGITIEGRMESRKWVDKDGNNRISWGVTCDNVEFPLGKGKGASSGAVSDSGLPFTMGDGDFKEIEGEEDLPF
jgi:single-strand DNA-binding protein